MKSRLSTTEVARKSAQVESIQILIIANIFFDKDSLNTK